MIFEDTYITDSGQELLTRAVNEAKIVWGKCGCYEHTGINSMSDAQINALTTLNNPCALGQASSVFYSASSTVRIDCQCSNSETGCTAGQALAFGLWAKIEGDASEVLVAIARTGAYTPTTFPVYDGTPQTKLIGVVDLNVTVNPDSASTITINPSVFALANDLQTEIEARQDLQERFEQIEGRVVTTHAYGSSTTGELQTIHGHKGFEDGVTIAKDYSSDNDNISGRVLFKAGSMNGNNGTLPDARLEVQKSNNETFGITVSHLKTKIVGPFEADGVSIPFGLAPTISNGEPVISSGNILMIGVKRISSGGSTPMPISVQTGDVIQDGSDVYVYAVNYGGGDWIIDEYVRYIGHKFRLMSGGEVGVGNDVIALAMVIE